MPNFNKKIKTKYGYFNFFFNRIYTAEGTRYHVSTIDENRKAVMFNMEEKNNLWTIENTKNNPEWLMNIEKELNEAIFEHLKS